MDNNNENLFSLAEIKIKNHRSPIHSKESMTIIQEEKKKEIIDKNKGNPKGIWKALKTLGGVKKDQVTSRQLITEHGAITDKQEIAEYMNDAFINTASKIIPGSQCVADLNLDDVALYEFVKSKSVL